MKQLNFEDIQQSRKILGLEEYSTLEEINSAYRKLALKFHPDKCKDSKKKNCEKEFKKISHAKDILLSYCRGYRYSFKEKDIKRSLFGKQFYEHLQRFYDDWWGEI